MNTLALAVQQGLGRDPHGGEIFCFRGRKGDLVKLLWHDGAGHVVVCEAARGGEVHLAGESGWNRRFDIGCAARLSSGGHRLAQSALDAKACKGWIISIETPVFIGDQRHLW